MGCLVLGLVAGGGAPASAATFRMEGRAETSLSAVPAWPTRWDDPVALGRDPLVLRLDLFGAELISGQDLRLVSSLRLGTDLGWRRGEVEALDGVERHRAEALLLSLVWTLPRPGLRLRLGRLLDLEAVRPRYFDGGSLGWSRGLFELEAFAGLSVKDGSLLAISTFEADGVRSSDAALAGRVDEASWPFVLTEAHSAPTLVWGASAGLGHLRHGSLRLGYEQASSEGTLERRLLTAQGQARHLQGFASGAMAFDLVRSELKDLDLQLGWGIARVGRLSVFHRRTRPVFDGDSIWNLFVRGDRDTTGVAWRAPLSWRVRLGLSFHDTRFQDPTLGLADHAVGLRLHAASARGRRLRFKLSGTFESGYGGTQGYLVGGLRWRIDDTLSARLRLAAGGLDDPSGAVGLVLGSRLGLDYRFDSSARAGVAVELNHSPLSRLDLRVLGRVEVGLDVLWGGRE